MTVPNSKGLTLDELLLRKEKTRQAIALQEQRIAEAYQQALSPVTNIKTVSSYIGGRILGGLTLIESALWGYRIISRVMRLFRRKRRF